MWEVTVRSDALSNVEVTGSRPTVTHTVDRPLEATVVEVLNSVSEIYAPTTLVCLTRTQPERVETYRYSQEANGHLYALPHGAQDGYVYRDGSDEFSWFMDEKGTRQQSGWTPFPFPLGIMAHSQIEVKSSEHGVAYTADEGIAHILQFLLNLGIYTEHSCECYHLSTHPFDGLFAYINVNTQHQGAPSRPNTDQLRSITATELASVLGLPAPGEGAARWQVNERNNVLLFDPAAVVLSDDLARD